MQATSLVKTNGLLFLKMKYRITNQNSSIYAERRYLCGASFFAF
jgi:hypothetical protein